MGWKDTAKEFAEDPQGFIWGIVLTGIIAGWQAGLDYLAEVGNVLAESIVVSTWGPLRATGQALETAIIEPYLELAAVITETAVAVGVFAPLAALLGWFIPLVILAFLARQALNFIDPVGVLEDLPWIGDRI
jgi:hypothetical protein